MRWISLLSVLLWASLALAQQPPSPEDALARCQGQLHAAVRTTAAAQESSGDIAVEMRRMQQQLVQVTQERDKLKQEREAAKALPADVPGTN